MLLLDLMREKRKIEDGKKSIRRILWYNRKKRRGKGAYRMMRGMRLKNREITDTEVLRHIVEECRTVRIGLADGEGMFIVPVNYGYEWKEESGGNVRLALYIHSAKEGRKAEAFREGGQAALELDRERGVIQGGYACSYSYSYQSIMGTGRITRLEKEEEKAYGLQKIMEHLAPGAEVRFEKNMLSAADVYRIDVMGFTGKERSEKAEKKAVIFDLDGTLWDSSSQVTKAWNTALSGYPELHVHLTDNDMKRFMGKTLDAIGEMMLPDVERSRREEIMKRCCAEEDAFLRAHGAKLYDGLLETLAALKRKYELFIVSNSQDGYIQCFLEYYRLHGFFTDFEMSGRTGLKKGENIRLVMRRNGIGEAVYVGDTKLDQEAADLAGIPFIHAAYGFGKPEGDAPKIRKLCELKTEADRLLGK